MKQTTRFLQVRSFLLVILLILPVSIVIGQSKATTRLGIVNPTPGIMSNTLNLVSKDYLKADSLVIVGVYHKSHQLQQPISFLKIKITKILP